MTNIFTVEEAINLFSQKQIANPPLDEIRQLFVTKNQVQKAIHIEASPPVSDIPGDTVSVASPKKSKNANFS